MSYKVTAPLVIVPNVDKTSGDFYGYQDALVPEGWNDERCKQLAEDGMVVKVDTPTDDDAEFDPATGGSIPVTLTWVGDEKSRAQQVLAIEEAKGDKARGGLVDKLEALLAAED